MVLLMLFFCARESYDVLALNLNETITRIHVTVPLKSSTFMFNARVGLGAGLSGDRTGALNKLSVNTFPFFVFNIAVIICLHATLRYAIPFWTKMLTFGPEHPKSNKPLRFLSLKEKMSSLSHLYRSPSQSRVQ